MLQSLGPSHCPSHCPSHSPSHCPIHYPIHCPIHYPSHCPSHCPIHSPSHYPSHYPSHGRGLIALYSAAKLGIQHAAQTFPRLSGTRKRLSSNRKRLESKTALFESTKRLSSLRVRANARQHAAGRLGTLAACSSVGPSGCNSGHGRRPGPWRRR